MHSSATVVYPGSDGLNRRKSTVRVYVDMGGVKSLTVAHNRARVDGAPVTQPLEGGDIVTPFGRPVRGWKKGA